MNREGDKLFLKWNDFQENAISAFELLREDREFVDLTLACEDGQQMEVHRAVFASSSPFFLNLLRKKKHPNPLIYFRGVKSEDLLGIVDFLYFGEANVQQKNLNSFFALAEEFQLKGLMESHTEKEQDSKATFHQPEPPKQIISKDPELQNIEEGEGSYTVQKVEIEPHLEDIKALRDFSVDSDLQKLDKTIKSMMEISDNIIGGSQGNRKKRRCKVCGKEDKMTGMKAHIEANHIIGVSHTCDNCGSVKSTRSALQLHKLRRGIGRMQKKTIDTFESIKDIKNA